MRSSIVIGDHLQSLLERPPSEAKGFRTTEVRTTRVSLRTSEKLTSIREAVSLRTAERAVRSASVGYWRDERGRTEISQAGGVLMRDAL